MITQPGNDTERAEQERQQRIVAEVHHYDRSDPPPAPRLRVVELPEMSDPSPWVSSYRDPDPKTSSILDQLERALQGSARLVNLTNYSQTIAINGPMRLDTERHGVPNHFSPLEPSLASRIVVQAHHNPNLMFLLTEEPAHGTLQEELPPPPYEPNDLS